MMRQCVILVGGKGLRLGELTKNTPKPMLKINGSPFLLQILNMAQRFGFKKILLLASHANKVIFDFFEHYEIDGLEIEILVEDKPLGTGGALVNAYDYLDEYFFCLNGDSIINGNWLSINQYQKENIKAVIALTEVNDSGRYGSIVLEKKRIVEFNEKNNQSGKSLINGGIYLLKKEIFREYKKVFLSLEKDIFPELVEKREVIGAKVNGFFIDIGTPKSFDFANVISWNNIVRAVIFDRDGTLNEDNGYTHKASDLKWKPGAIELIKYLNDNNFYVFVATNQAGIAKGKFLEKDMHFFHEEMQSQLWSYGAHIDKFYFCPFHKDASLETFKKDSNRRKPDTGMLIDIESEWGLSKKNMTMIGDRDSDMICAKNFKIKGLMYNGKDNLLKFFKEN